MQNSVEEEHDLPGIAIGRNFSRSFFHVEHCPRHTFFFYFCSTRSVTGCFGVYIELFPTQPRREANLRTVAKQSERWLGNNPSM